MHLGLKAKVAAIKAADFVALKTMKNVPASLKLSLISACVLTEAIVVDNTSEATAKKMVNLNSLFPRKIFFETELFHTFLSNPLKYPKYV